MFLCQICYNSVFLHKIDGWIRWSSRCLPILPLCVSSFEAIKDMEELDFRVLLMVSLHSTKMKNLITVPKSPVSFHGCRWSSTWASQVLVQHLNTTPQWHYTVSCRRAKNAISCVKGIQCALPENTVKYYCTQVLLIDFLKATAWPLYKKSAGVNYPELVWLFFPILIV